YPLVFTSFWIERQLGVHKAGKGLEVDRVWGNHAINMLIHALAGILLWRCLVKLRMPPGWAWLASAIWLVHPLQVESVVWAAERKNTMSGLFYFASAWMYLHAGQRMRCKAYAAALFLFLCMMLSKTATMLLPLTLLLIEWLQGRRIGRAALLRVAPFFAIGVLLAATMVSGEQSVVIVETLTARLMIAGQAFWFYLYKLLWPLNAITIYPRWDTTLTALKMIPLAAALAAGLWWTVAALRRKPEQSLATAVVLIAVSQYVATVGPALGVVAWPHMDRTFVANHFTYVALVGPIVLLVLALRRLVQRAAARPKAIQAALAVSVLVTALLSAYSFKRSLAWRNNGTLIADILAVNPDCPEARALRSMELLQQNKPDQAIEEMQWVVGRNPLYPRARLELANMLAAYRKDYDAAIEHIRAAIQMQPDMNWYLTLARLLRDAGRYDDALRELDRMSPRNRRSASTLSLEALILCRLKPWSEAVKVSERLGKPRPGAGWAALLDSPPAIA
ncbi:MAG: tetratricopeptide repeat protein, partial [Proteobacteria bacterium]|nr:tetratricopeptide repeat protein [Pseudomonadota bacterium]